MGSSNIIVNMKDSTMLFVKYRLLNVYILMPQEKKRGNLYSSFELYYYHNMEVSTSRFVKNKPVHRNIYVNDILLECHRKRRGRILLHMGKVRNAVKRG